MKLPVFALFERALRHESRSALAGWSRVGLLGIILFVLLPVESMARSGYYGAPGLTFLQEMAWINLVFITLAGLSYFASAITEEKEESMLGLLRMTDLNAVAILLGKSTSRLIGAILFLLVQVPFILLAVTLGGVGVTQIMAAYATLLAYLFLLCNVALFFSVVFRSTGTAAAVTLLFVILFFFGWTWAAVVQRSFVPFGSDSTFWLIVERTIDIWARSVPARRLPQIFQTGFSGPAFGFQVASNLILGVVFFLLAWVAFDRFNREDKEAAPARPFLSRATKRRSRIPVRIMGSRVITWKDFTFISGGKVGLIGKFLLIASVVGICNVIATQSGSRVDLAFNAGVLIWVSLIITAVALALEASRIFKDEVRWKTLSSLMTLPISVSELAYRKVAGALAGTLPLLAGFVIGVLLVPDKANQFLSEMGRHPAEIGLLIVLILQYVLFLHLVAFLSLVLKRGALPLAIAIQYVGGMFVMAFMAFLFRAGEADMLFLIGFFCVVATLLLHWAIGGKLAQAAVEA